MSGLHAPLYTAALPSVSCSSGWEYDRRSPHFDALVMTSGNISEEPIIKSNEEAVERLKGIVDAFLIHNRDIFMRVDDSVLRIMMQQREVLDGTTSVSFIRRSRDMHQNLSHCLTTGRWWLDAEQMLRTPLRSHVADMQWSASISAIWRTTRPSGF